MLDGQWLAWMAGLHPMSPSLASERGLHVVFVHGLGGDPLTPLRTGDDTTSSWPHRLAEEFRARMGSG